MDYNQRHHQLVVEISVANSSDGVHPQIIEAKLMHMKQYNNRDIVDKDRSTTYIYTVHVCSVYRLKYKSIFKSKGFYFNNQQHLKGKGKLLNQFYKTFQKQEYPFLFKFNFVFKGLSVVCFENPIFFEHLGGFQFLKPMQLFIEKFRLLLNLPFKVALLPFTSKF